MATEAEWQRKRIIFFCAAIWITLVFVQNTWISNNRVTLHQKNKALCCTEKIRCSLESMACHLEIANYAHPSYDYTDEEQENFAKTTEVELVETIDTEVEVAKTEETEVELAEITETTEATAVTAPREVDDVQIGVEYGTFFLERKEPIQYTEEDLWYLANGIYSEAGICSDMEEYRCGQVMLDRLLDTTGRFPQTTMKGILCATGQFGCVGGKAWRHGPTEREYQIARDLFEGARVFPENVVWFNNKHDYGYLYCHAEYHYFSGYLDNGGRFVTASKAIEEQESEIVVEEENSLEENVEAMEETTTEEVPESVVEITTEMPEVVEEENLEGTSSTYENVTSEITTE